MLNDIRIAISGRSGCGNTTVSRALADYFGLRFINYTFRSIAEEDGLTFEEITRRAELSDDDDLRVDTTQIELARQSPSVLGSRLAIWMLKEADLKVFLTAPLETRAGRIRKREGGTLEHAVTSTMSRDERDHSRYLRLYGIDNYDLNMADLVVNTDRFNVNQVVDIIKSAANAIIYNKTLV